MRYSREDILKLITYNLSGFNSAVLKANMWPGLFYGINYRRNKNHPGVKNSTEELIKITNHAIKSVPYYSRLYSSQISSLEDFWQKIGFIDRNEVASHHGEFISRQAKLKRYTYTTTGGTSGKPLKFLINRDRYAIELAYIHNLWKRAGWNYHVRGVLRNHHLPEDRAFIINPVTREVIFDNFRLSHTYVREINEVLKKYDICYLHAYPSAAYEFCKLSREAGLDISYIKAFLCGSESVLDFQKKLITDELGVKIYSWYGHSEKLVLGGYCESTEHYHMEPGYGYFELVDANGNRISEPGKVGEIVGTTFYNYGMPLIRYRTGDYAEFVGHKCESCNREMPLVKNIQGRWENNRIYKKDGTYISTTSLNLHNDLYTYIDGLQYVQDRPGLLEVRVVRNLAFKTIHERLLTDHFEKSFGPDNQVVINYVDKLMVKPNGKFELLISNFKIEN